MKEVFQRRFDELAQSMGGIEIRSYERSPGHYVVAGTWEGWGTSVEHLIQAAFGQGSPHYVNYSHAYAECRGSVSEVRKLMSLFKGAKEDYDGGYVFAVELRISGEVFGDFVALARQALSEGNKDVAAVLACAALEDALKRYASVNSLSVDGKTMSDVVNALKGAQLVGGAQKSLLEAMPRIRNMAMHGEWAKITEPDVASVLGFVEQFLLSKFSE